MLPKEEIYFCGSARIVGDDFMVLSNEYDENQYWFSFVNVLLSPSDDFMTTKKDSEQYKKQERERKNARRRKTKKVPYIDRKLYAQGGLPMIYSTDQMNLPFHEARQLVYDMSNGVFEDNILDEINWPGWGDNKGKPIELHLTSTELYREWRKPESWCNENCIGRYQVTVWNNKRICAIFEKQDDAALFKLRWA